MCSALHINPSSSTRYVLLDIKAHSYCQYVGRSCSCLLWDYKFHSHCSLSRTTVNLISPAFNSAERSPSPLKTKKNSLCFICPLCLLSFLKTKTAYRVFSLCLLLLHLPWIFKRPFSSSHLLLVGFLSRFAKLAQQGHRMPQDFTRYCTLHFSSLPSAFISGSP